ncbi:MAG: 16S rRNA (guanine(966)-N(2))-methyltransferase RsmD [Alphaproteobacteria bacterium]
MPPGDAVRPTADRVREAVFSMLESGRYGGNRVAGARVLDAFAGSGALGLEALSRGAAHATFMDNAGQAIAAVEANVRALGVGARARVLRADATRPPPAPAACDLLFLDPPYRDGAIGAALAALAAAGWIAAGALLVVEREAKSPLDLAEGMRLEAERRYGRAAIALVAAAG